MLSRWSKLKSANTLQAKAPNAPLDEASLPIAATGDADVAVAASEQEPATVENKPELPNIADLTPESDFKPFMQPGVDALDRNAALKKLFTDPHYNQMDGLDIYIDDYGKPDPIPAEMLKRLMASKFLGLYEEPEKVAEEEVEARVEGRDTTLSTPQCTRENPSSDDSTLKST
jgi:hypothetical protein